MVTRAVARPARGCLRSAELGEGGGHPDLRQGGAGWLGGEPRVLGGGLPDTASVVADLVGGLQMITGGWHFNSECAG